MSWIRAVNGTLNVRRLRLSRFENCKLKGRFGDKSMHEHYV